ncbi:hypothetical protein [Coleofasciculus sp. F4-SAH-05]|uniref:hypothetical protein n=1 Tax=Coleofasciculus sp. F4-SAH-05 TaxID=3069525 RepID=UPI0032F99335
MSFVLRHLLFVFFTFYRVNFVKIRASPNQGKFTIAPPASRRSTVTSLLTTILIQQTLIK